ncbi:type II secretion system protein [bacterium]|nr:type II secretion system protein [bacterium]
MNNRRSGMTLLEVLVGFTILLIGASSILVFLVFFIKMNITIQGKMQSKFIAEQFTEQIRAMSYRDPDLVNDGDNADLSDFTNPDHSAVDTVDQKIYNRYWNVAEDIPMSGMKTIKIRITWQQVDKEQVYEFSTLKGSG